jgi:hypothetical protein
MFGCFITHREAFLLKEKYSTTCVDRALRFVTALLDFILYSSLSLCILDL